ncbi:Trm112 family protein [Chryseosolibacter indicus]|uniref:Trm112 family protein n=1 Tax=Chryseosolibacter indicus TaxID=2782351 RepID=A0ABS5VYJ8_9BACT|nr:Trm112 family protein [Chryseosolibacter indicus]MBT1706488.1 hypothetical protein [Chryseosolibacter indicus]
MKQSFLSKLACPFDKEDLSIRIFKQDNQEILEGILTCNHCNRYYPIVQGIPIMSPDEYRELSLEIPILEKWGVKVLAEKDRPVFKLVAGNDNQERLPYNASEEQDKFL